MGTNSSLEKQISTSQPQQCICVAWLPHHNNVIGSCRFLCKIFVVIFTVRMFFWLCLLQRLVFLEVLAEEMGLCGYACCRNEQTNHIVCACWGTVHWANRNKDLSIISNARPKTWTFTQISLFISVHDFNKGFSYSHVSQVRIQPVVPIATEYDCIHVHTLICSVGMNVLLLFYYTSQYVYLFTISDQP